MHIREFLLQNRWRDKEGNTLVFSPQDLAGEPAKETSIWLFLDEGGCCGGRRAEILPSIDAVCTILENMGKKELLTCFQTDCQKKGLLE